MTTRKTVGKNGPRFSLGHIMEGLRSEHETRQHNGPTEQEALVYDANKPEHNALYRRFAAKAERIEAERLGIRGKFVPLSARGKNAETEELERYNPEPRFIQPKLRFAGRDKLKVQGYGPGYRPSK